MKTRMKFVLTPLAAAVIGTLAVYGCGGSGTEPVTPTATVVAPVVNTPLKDVTVTLTCADGAVGGTGTAVDGSVSIVVPTTCATPFTMTVSGTGTMAGPDLAFGTDDDEAYDSATRTALKSIVQTGDLSSALTSGASITAPSITSLTTLVAETVAKANPTSAEIDAAKATVAGVTGVAAADLYKNPMTNGDVFKAATLVNELVASGMQADPTQTPAGLVKAMAANTTAKLTDTTIDPAAMMGLSTANAAIVQAQMSTMQAKADAMKSVADAVAANVLSADQAALMPADAARAMAAALAGAQGGDASTTIAKAKMAQDTMKQMAAQMDALRKDTTVVPADLQAKMAALVQGMEAVRVEQVGIMQTSITAAAGDATKIADAIKQSSGVIIASAPAMLNSVSTSTVTDLQKSGFMAAAAASIANQIAAIPPADLAAAMATAGGDPSKVLTTLNLNPTTMATTAATGATQAANLALTPPTALSAYPALAGQVVGMVINRASNTNALSSANLQAWVNAIGTALAANSPTLLNPGSVVDAFAKLQPDLAAAPGTLTMTLVAAPVFEQSTTPITPTQPGGIPTTPTTQPSVTSTQPSVTSTQPGVTSTEPSVTSTQPSVTSTQPSVTSTSAIVVVTSTTVTTAASTTTTTIPAASAFCQITYGNISTYVSGAPACNISAVKADIGGTSGTTVTGIDTLPTGKTAVAYSSLATCDPFASPPAAGATTINACK